MTLLLCTYLSFPTASAGIKSNQHMAAVTVQIPHASDCLDAIMLTHQPLAQLEKTKDAIRV